jgi:imidazolonepropionase-like amidohydrolase
LSVAKVVPAGYPEEKAIVSTAKDYGLQVAARTCDEGMQRAIKEGVKTIEHGTEMSDATMDLMIKYNAYYIPTFCRKFVKKALIPIQLLLYQKCNWTKIKATFAKA